MIYEYKNWENYFWNSIYLYIKSYPINNANESIKKKYYVFFTNLPSFVPNKKIKTELSYYTNKFSITPYLDNKYNLLKWVNFIHNKISIKNNIKPKKLNERIQYINILFNPPITKTYKKNIPINKKNVYTLIMLYLTIYIVYSFI